MLVAEPGKPASSAKALEADRYRAQGFRADAFHNGDAYFVNVYR